MTRRWYLYYLFFSRPPQLSIFIDISLSSRTRVTSFIIFFNFITRRGLVFKSEVSMNNESKKGYLEESIGGLLIIVVVKLETILKLLFGTSLFPYYYY